MNLMMLLDMASSAYEDRIAVTDGDRASSYRELHDTTLRASSHLRGSGAGDLVFLAPTGFAFAVGLFAAAGAGIPFVPMSYRLGVEQLQTLLDRHRDALVVAEGDVASMVRAQGLSCMSRFEWLQIARATPHDGDGAPNDGDGVAVLLYTSGTTAAPKAAILRHRHVLSYLLRTVDFAGAGEDEATIASVPPYHVAGVSNTLSNVYSGRRIVYMEAFSPEAWLSLARREETTHALVVPTMLARIVDHLGSSESAEVPALRSIAYGGSRMPRRVIERALELFPHVEFVNAYGLTETSSTIALLDAKSHRDAMASSDQAVRARLESAGRIIPGIELEVRRDDGVVLGPNEVGELFVRGDQVSGEYAGQGQLLDAAGWFATRDRGWIDEEGYLFIEGRSDDTIIRGGENIAPAELEDVLLRHPGVLDAAVVGVPDEEWGQRIAAVIVRREDQPAVPAEAITTWMRERLRGSKVPDYIYFRDDLPRTDTGKLVRRTIVADLIASSLG